MNQKPCYIFLILVSKIFDLQAATKPLYVTGAVTSALPVWGNTLSSSPNSALLRLGLWRGSSHSWSQGCQVILVNRTEWYNWLRLHFSLDNLWILGEKHGTYNRCKTYLTRHLLLGAFFAFNFLIIAWIFIKICYVICSIMLDTFDKSD